MTPSERQEFEEMKRELATLRQAITVTPGMVNINKPVQIRGPIYLNGVHIYGGEGTLPTVGVPNGSLYLNRNGGGGSTLYVRVTGNWFGET